MPRVGTGYPLSMILCMVLLCTSAFWLITLFFLLSDLPIVSPMMVISRCYLKRSFEACQFVTRNTGRSHAPFISSNRHSSVCWDLLVDPEASQNQAHPGHMYKYIYANSLFSSPFSTKYETEGFFLQEQCSLGRHKRMYMNTKPLMSMGILNVYSSISWAQPTFFSASYNKLAWGGSRLGPLLPPCAHLLIFICFKLEPRLYKPFSRFFISFKSEPRLYKAFYRFFYALSVLEGHMYYTWPRDTQCPPNFLLISGLFPLRLFSRFQTHDCFICSWQIPRTFNRYRDRCISQISPFLMDGLLCQWDNLWYIHTPHPRTG